MKKKTLAAGLALAMTLGLSPVQAANTTYLDVDRSIWYSKPVAFCQQHLLMDGVSSSSFQPEEPLTRAVLAEALYRLEGSPATEENKQEESNQEETEQEDNNQEEDNPEESNQEESKQEENEPGENDPEENNQEENGQESDGQGELSFTDIKSDHPNYAAISWARNHGVISGYPDGTFRPNAPITREEIAVLLWSNREQQTAASKAPYTDREDIGDWARPAVDWAYGAKMMTGNTDGTFCPQNNTTRAEGATIVMNYAQAYYGMTYGYTLPEPSPIRENTYSRELYSVDEETGYLSYLDGTAVLGIDVSAWQEDINWVKVAATGVRFAMIRAGYRGYTKGAIQKDEYFDANMRGALANGIEVGVYFFSQAITPAEAEEEANLLLKWMKGYNVTYPVVFDWEEQKYDNSRTKGCDGNTVTACALAFCKVIEDAGYTPMTYGSPSKVYNGGLALEYLQKYPFWLAHYTINAAPTSFRYHYNIWQYSDSGRVDGIRGKVDMDICLTPNWNNQSTGSNNSKYDWLLPF